MVLDKLIDEIRDDENHPLILAMQIIRENLESFDEENFLPIGKNNSDIEMVQYLMTSNNLHQKDLTDIFGGQANVSKFFKRRKRTQ